MFSDNFIRSVLSIFFYETTVLPQNRYQCITPRVYFVIYFQRTCNLFVIFSKIFDGNCYIFSNFANKMKYFFKNSLE